jgi:hypothetical protein
MNWLNAGWTGISSWLSLSEKRRRPKAGPQDLERARKAMLDTLGEAGAAANPALRRRIQYTGELEGLWYLRSDLMAALAHRHGEAEAHIMLQPITALLRAWN